MLTSRSLARLARPALTASLLPSYGFVFSQCLCSTQHARLASFQPHRLTPSALENAASLSSVDAGKLAKANNHKSISRTPDRQSATPPSLPQKNIQAENQTRTQVLGQAKASEVPELHPQAAHSTPASHPDSPAILPSATAFATATANIPATATAATTATTATPHTPTPTTKSPSPTLGATSPTTPSVKPPARKSRLRMPRKAAIKLTPAAIEQLRDLLDQPEPKLIRVGVRNRGCSGLAYHLEYVDKPGQFDEKVEQDGVMVLIDSKALFSIIGSEMDWVEDNLLEKFVFKNPNIKDQCGCGESFMV
ncbi:Iron-sulfur assembly protein 1 [Ceratocystis pirilliformis]|uniref:Iron-sulfur assembly protein 1 n=1 Tax=Ceratocystis pirilliformis TaxID=259994 RepID=A0ABR3YT52_9PEZI